MKTQKPTRRKRKPATVTLTSRFEVTVELKVAKSLVTEVLKPDWKKNFYNLLTPNDVGDHLAFNLIQGRSLTSLDGFAHLQDEDAKIAEMVWTGIK